MFNRYKINKTIFSNKIIISAPISLFLRIKGKDTEDLNVFSSPESLSKDSLKRLALDLLFFKVKKGERSKLMLTGIASKEYKTHGNRIIKAKRIGNSTVQQNVMS